MHEFRVNSVNLVLAAIFMISLMKQSSSMIQELNLQQKLWQSGIYRRYGVYDDVEVSWIF